jgi:hypothetical protein
MKSVEWKTYRTRFLVRAKKLNYALSFTDQLGRQHCGRKGDYLVESSEGVLSIAPRQIFEDIYVPMPRARKGTPDFERNENLLHGNGSNLQFPTITVEDLRVETVGEETFRYPAVDRRAHHDSPPRTRRKSPQPVRNPTPRLGLM